MSERIAAALERMIVIMQAQAERDERDSAILQDLRRVLALFERRLPNSTGTWLPIKPRE